MKFKKESKNGETIEDVKPISKDNIRLILQTTPYRNNPNSSKLESDD